MVKPFQSKPSTLFWQYKNAESLWKTKNSRKTGELLKLYRVPEGVGQYSLYGFGGKKGREPKRMVKVEGGSHLNPRIRTFGVVDASKPNQVEIMDTRDLKTGKSVYFHTKGKGVYSEWSGTIEDNDLDELGVKIDISKPVEFIEIQYPYVKMTEGVTDGRSVAKVETDKGTLIQVVEHCIVPESMLDECCEENDNCEKITAQKITLYLNGIKVKEYFDDFYYGSKLVG